MRSECPLTLKLYYDDPRLTDWWSHMLPAQSEGLYACPTPCAITPVRGEADVLVRMFSPTHRDAKETWQKTAVVNTEAHSFSRENLEATDLLVSFHRHADVVVGYAPFLNVHNPLPAVIRPLCGVHIPLCQETHRQSPEGEICCPASMPPLCHSLIASPCLPTLQLHIRDEARGPMQRRLGGLP